jgi:nitrate/TMAO reductase-like tetraheme cytochrome c subunit
MNNRGEKKEDPSAVRFEDFAGSEKCAGCHKNIYNAYIQTAHYRTLQPPEEKIIMGSFEKGKNSFSYSPDIKLVMEKRDSGFYQVAYYKGDEKIAMRFDMVIGSGVMGQSFLSWRNKKLFQLPITFFTAANQWSNSPGLRSDKVVIDKPVTSRCLECHASYAEGISGPPLEPMEFNHNRIIYGINCERCHGPAAKHVEYQTKNPLEKAGKFIINPASLSRQLQLDICALCHGGNIKKTKPSFRFTAGKNLADYFVIDSMNEEVARNGNIDVHGNNYGLLKASKCFKMSVQLTCNSCHNTHEDQRGKTELFSQKCMECHDVKTERFKTSTHAQVIGIEKNCIDCHMPAQASKSIAVKLEGEEVLRASLIRTHFIGIYTDKKNK